MKNYLSLIIIIFYAAVCNANEVEVIELHQTINLDQLVLEKSNNKIVEENAENSVEVVVEEDTITEDNGNQDISVEQEEINKQSFWHNIDLEKINGYFENIDNINSDIVNNEVSTLLQQSNLDSELENNEIVFYLTVKFFYDTGNISKAYNLINSKNIKKNNNYLIFYKTIKVNYLLSTFQLEAACDLKNSFSDQVKLKNYLIEKLDIFCTVLENKLLEADLLNSILLETEQNIDLSFQSLYNFISKNDENTQPPTLNLNNTNNSNLLFLYSAMARIAEIPLNENFLEIDSVNLSIPIILNRSTPIDLRIKAANNSFINNIISSESLAALYQSVDFTSDQLNSPEETINSFSGNIELLMSYYFQLINIQIFPSERLQAILNFWEFAKENNLEEISYSLTNSIIDTFEPTAETLKYAPQISEAYLYNKNFEKADNWISLYENSFEQDKKSSYIRILLNLHSKENLSDILQLIMSNFDIFLKSDNISNQELIYILLDVLGKSHEKILSENFNLIYDQRLMPSVFIIKNISDSINKNDENKFLIYSAISINDKNWNDLHPNHLKLILEGFLKYKDGEVIKELILEIFKNYKIL